MNANQYLQTLLTLPSVEYSLLSPDGRWLAFAWLRMHPNLDVFLVPTDGSAPPLALTNTPEQTTPVSWTADSQAVIVAEDHAGDEHTRLFRVAIDQPGELHPLTEDAPPYFLRGGALSPDGQTLYYGANYDFNREQVIEPTWIYRHDLQTSKRTPLTKPLKPLYTAPELNRAGTHLIYARSDHHPAGRQFHLVDVAGERDEEILNFGIDSKVFADWLPDSQNLLVIGEACSPGSQQPDYKRLGIYHFPSKWLRWLLDEPWRNIEGAWVSPDGTIIVDEIEQASHRATLLNPADGSTIQLPTMPGNLLPLGRAADGAWIARYYSSTSPAELVRFNLQPGRQPNLVSLTRLEEKVNLAELKLIPAESIRWISDDGQPVQGWLYRAHPNRKRAVILIHGGPTSHAEDQFKPIVVFLVSQGFNVLDVNYRGSTGFGLKFRELIKEDGWGGHEQSDIASGAETLIRDGLAEPGKVGVFGTSYGGYSSWFLITHYLPEVIAAAAPICGMTDLVVDYRTTRPDLRPYSEEMIGGTPEQVPEKYFERSPINFVQNIRGRLLIVQGARDPNVTPENVHQVRQRLDALRIPYELLVFDDEGHGIAKPANQAVLYQRLADFFMQAFG
jgi:dipeptidyl aminopeptidase/acylaminoacyl peptidase